MKPTIDVVDVFYGYMCNLNCRGCSTGSDIIKTRDYDLSLDSIIKSIHDLSKHFNVTRFSLLGGEPFLYWDTSKTILECLNETFPDSTLTIVTNGTLVHKYVDDIFDFTSKLSHPLLSISNHHGEFLDDPQGQAYIDRVSKLLTDTRLDKRSDALYESNVSNLKVVITEHPNLLAQFVNIKGKLRPFATNDPAGSMEKGCFGPRCSALAHSKLYKCARFINLPHILDQVNQLDDPAWQKYLNYVPVDLTLDSLGNIGDQFAENQGKPINECDMCSNKHVINLTVIPQTKENVVNRRA